MAPQNDHLHRLHPKTQGGAENTRLAKLMKISLG